MSKNRKNRKGRPFGYDLDRGPGRGKPRDIGSRLILTGLSIGSVLLVVWGVSLLARQNKWTECPGGYGITRFDVSESEGGFFGQDIAGNENYQLRPTSEGIIYSLNGQPNQLVLYNTQGLAEHTLRNSYGWEKTVVTKLSPYDGEIKFSVSREICKK